MGQKNSKKCSKKRKDRERRIHKNRRVISEKRMVRELERRILKVSPFPKFEIESSDGSTNDIQHLVEEGIKAFEPYYAKTVDNDVLGILAEQHQDSWAAFINRAAGDITDLTRCQVDRSYAQLVENELGTKILQHSPKNLQRRVLPTSSFSLRPSDRSWIIRCRSLVETRSDIGLLYQSPHHPSIRIDGKRRKVAFSKHAIVQLADRILPKWANHYIGQLYVFGFFYECVHFGKAKLSNGQHAFVVYNSCLRAGSALRKFIQELMGFASEKDLLNHYYVVGYCPVIIDGDIAVAKTFLTPGYWQTPERKTLELAVSPLELLQDIEQASDEGINLASVATSERTKAAIRWFHSHGVPQVKKIEREVFKDMDGPYSWIMNELEVDGVETPNSADA